MSVAVAVTVLLLPGLQVVGHPPVLGIVAFALFMALINASIKPLTHMIALPFSVLSFGIAALVINWLFMRLASWLAISLFDVGVTVNGFWWSVLASLIISIVSGGDAIQRHRIPARSFRQTNSYLSPRLSKRLPSGLPGLVYSQICNTTAASCRSSPTSTVPTAPPLNCWATPLARVSANCVG